MSSPMNAYLASAISASQPSDNTLRVGTVVSLDGTTLRVEINSGVIDAGWLSTFAPQVGQTVAVMRESAGWLVIGPIQGPASPPELSSLVRETKVVPSNVTFTATAFEDDPYLWIDMPPEGRYSVYLQVAYQATTALTSVRFTMPTGAILHAPTFNYDPGTDDWQVLTPGTSPAGTVVGLATTAVGAGAAPLIQTGVIQMNGVGGRLQWQRAKSAATGTSAIWAGSLLRVERCDYREEG